MQGKTINGFELRCRLGVGGMAEVWYAENRIGKKAAVKLLLPKLCQDENVVSRFLTEAKVVVDLNHPNIRQVYDYGELDGRPTIIMEYLEGDDLKARMKRGQHFTDEELKKWWNQLVSALNYTHQKGIVHRDIKPGNIFVDNEGNVKLLDFGIAKVRESISSTQTGQKLGTLMYMSPEQVKDSKHVDYRTDVYSLAVTFVNLLTGKKPYDSDTSSDFEISEQIVYKPLDLRGLPSEWQVFLTPYLNKEPEQRPALCEFKNANSHAANVGSDDEDTIVGDAPTKTMPKKEKSQRPSQSERKPVASDSNQGKSKKGLWIGLGAAAVAVAVLLLLLIMPKEEPVVVDPDTEAYQACQTIADYREYIRDYGRNAIHYNEAKQYVDNYVADSIQKAQEEKSKADAMSVQEELERKEKMAYEACTSIAACDIYLKTYPSGRYVENVKSKKKELEETEMSKDNKPSLTEMSKDKKPSLHNVSSGPQGNYVCTYYFFDENNYSINNNNSNKAASNIIRDKLDEGVSGFRVVSWVAPVDKEETAMEIAKSRGKAVQSEIAKLLKQKNNSNSYDIQLYGAGYDWFKFMTLLEHSGIKDKQQIIATINNSSNKERTIDEMCMLYPEISREILPMLRRVEVYVY